VFEARHTDHHVSPGHVLIDRLCPSLTRKKGKMIDADLQKIRYLLVVHLEQLAVSIKIIRMKSALQREIVLPLDISVLHSRIDADTLR
jgi:hypothetical protein